MNLVHRWYCKSNMWARQLHQYMPRMVEGVELGDSVLEIGSGPGVSTDWLRTRVPHLTTIEIDHALAQSLSRRLEGENVTVVEGDATAMTFPDASFSSAFSFTMLHHVPSPELQDKLLAETCRVLRPGGTFSGSDTARRASSGTSSTSSTRECRSIPRRSRNGWKRPDSRTPAYFSSRAASPSAPASRTNGSGQP